MNVAANNLKNSHAFRGGVGKMYIYGCVCVCLVAEKKIVIFNCTQHTQIEIIWRENSA